MSDDLIIRAENIGKRYTLSHQGRGHVRYARFSESLAHWAAGPVRWLRRRGGGQAASAAISSSPSQEDFWALKDVSFEIKRGEVVGIIGRNGAGKSTLLKILSRITEPTTGRITLDGRVASLLEVGTGFHPELTGRENVFLNGAILGMTRAEIRAKFDEIVAFAEIEKFLDTPVKRYSSGMYVRLAFAVAAHLEPEILVVDEVLAVGDAQFQQKCLGKMQDVAGRGRTVLFVSHNMEMMDRLTSQTIWLSRGSVLQHGPTRQVVAAYLNQREQGGDLDTHRVSSIPGTARILGLATRGADGQVQTSFRQGEVVSLSLELESAMDRPFDVAVVIENDRDAPLFTTHLTDAGAPVSKAGRVTLSVALDPPVLRSGNYRVSLAVFSPDKAEFYDVIHHFPAFEVAGTVDLNFPEDIRWGDLFLPLRWTRGPGAATQPS